MIRVTVSNQNTAVEIEQILVMAAISVYRNSELKAIEQIGITDALCTLRDNITVEGGAGSD
jgi:hypothetical protein